MPDARPAGSNLHSIASGHVHVVWLYSMFWHAFERGESEAAWDILRVLASAAVPQDGLCRMRGHQCAPFYCNDHDRTSTN